MLTVYGIANCDTVKKARRWLQESGVEYAFHDYKKQGCDPTLAREILESLPFEEVVNKRGTTWRKLPDEDKAGLDASSARELIQRETSVIKRPLFRRGDAWLLGFDEESLKAFLAR